MEIKEKREYFQLPNQNISLYTSLMYRGDTIEHDKKDLLVLLNGFGRTFLDFQSMRKSLHSFHENLVTLSLDNRFSGKTIVSKDDDASIPSMANDVLMLVNYYLNNFHFKSYDLLGISMGGMIAQSVAASNPFLGNLILVSTTIGGPLRVFSKERPKKDFEELSQDNVQEKFSKYVSNYFKEKNPELFKMFLRSLEKVNKKENSFSLKKQHDSSISFDGTLFYDKIKARTLIIHGEDDSIIPFENAYILNERIQGSSLLSYKKVGHLILLENSRDFVSDVSHFLFSQR